MANKITPPYNLPNLNILGARFAGNRYARANKLPVDGFFETEDYVAGSAGWHLGQDFVEILDAIIRGELSIGGASRIGDDGLLMLALDNSGGGYILADAIQQSTISWSTDLDDPENTYIAYIIGEFDGGGGGGADRLLVKSLGGVSVLATDEILLAGSQTRVNNALQIGTGSTPIARVNIGRASETTDSSGYITFAHGHAAVPERVLLTAVSPVTGTDIPVGLIYDEAGSDATDLSVRCINQSGAAINTVAVEVDWMALSVN